ncbi:MAG: hypothetical protein AAGJ46_09755 [Planctomycetota bacterium]
MKTPKYRSKRQPASSRRPSSRQRGYTTQWDREAKAFRQEPENAVCAECLRHGITTASQCDESLFWDKSNWQALSFACHNQKTGRGE